MKVLVTGADGMLGSNLVRSLIAKGYEVSVLLHPSTKSTSLEGLYLQKYYGDVLNPDSLDLAIKNKDVIVHAAASTSVWPSRSETVRKVNINGTQNIIDKALQHHINKLIYIGSASSVNTAADTKSKYLFPGAKFKLDYIDSKYHALNLVLKAVKEKKLPALAILPTYMIGPYDSLPGSGKMILALAKGKLKFYSSGGRNFVHVKDVASAIVNSIELSETGRYYVVGNENLSYKAFFKIAAPIVGQPVPKIKIPDWIVKSIGFAGTFYGEILNTEPMISYPIARASCENQFVNSTEDGQLKIPKTPIEEAVKDCFEWFKKNGYI